MVNRWRPMLVAALLLMAGVCVVPALAVADVVVPPSQSPSVLPTPSPTSASPSALPASTDSGSGGGAVAATVGGGIAVAVLAVASWLFLRRAAARRVAGAASTESAAGEAGDTGELG
jgi:hypothetical protein